MTDLMNAMVADLRRDEGERLKPYRDTVGKLTIGVGRNLDDVGLSPEESAYLLANDINKVLRQLDEKLPWWRGLCFNRQRVLINMAFNLGIAGLLGFRNTLAAVQAGQYDKAAEGMLSSKWATQVGKRAVRLADLMRNG